MSVSSLIAQISAYVAENKVRTTYKATKEEVAIIANLDEVKNK